MRCVFDVQHTPGMQSTFHRSCSSITCELLSAEMFQMARAVDNKRQQTTTNVRCSSLAISILPATALLPLHHILAVSPNFRFPVTLSCQVNFAVRSACLSTGLEPWRVFAVLVAILLLPNNSFCHFCVTCLASPDTFWLLNSTDQEIKIKSYSVVVLLGCLQKLSAVRFSRVWTCANLFRTLICF